VGVVDQDPVIDLRQARGDERRDLGVPDLVLDPADRPAAVNPWQWSSQGGPDADDETNFLSKFETSVHDAWTGQHPFHATKKYWEDLGANVTVNVTVSKVADATAKGADQHMLVNANKVPVGFVGGAADVHRATGKTGPTDNIMTVTSEDVVPRKDGLLESEVDFQPSGSCFITK